MVAQPTFGIYGELEADLDMDLSVSADLAYNVDGAKAFFPADVQPSAGGFTPADSSETISPAMTRPS